jgi:molybdopterin/thiamine biosynthesis adenylyltransferase
MEQPTVYIHSQPLPDGLGRRYSAESDVSLADLLARTPFAEAGRQRLQESRVVIIGAGSGGSQLALALGQAGVGHQVLVDHGYVAIHNCIRHLATLQDVGRPKVEVVAEQVLLHNPQVIIDTYAADLFQPDSPVAPEAVLAGAALVIAATDRTAVQLAINAVTWRLGVPAVFGGCYEGARGGEVLYTLPGEATPCLNCLRGGLAQPERGGPFDYSAAQHPEDFEGEPGLKSAIDFITNVEAQVALGLLLRGTGSSLEGIIVPPYNFLLIGGALAADFYRFKRPFHIFFQPLSGPRPDCDVCAATDGETDPSFLELVRQEEMTQADLFAEGMIYE